MKTVSVRVKDIRCQDRYEPEYWIISDHLNSLFNQSKWHKFEEDTRFVRKGIFDLKAERYQSQGIPFLRISNLKYFELDKAGMVFISEEDNLANKKTMLKEGDIAFSKIGTLGKILRISDEYKCVNLSQNLIGAGLRAGVDKNYIFAFLLSRCALLQINKNRKKQLQDKLNLNDVKDIRIIDIDETNRIEISSMVQEAVDLTRKINKLIQSARELFYKRLCIDFGTVDKVKFFSVNKNSFAKEGLWTPEYSSPLYNNTLKTIKEKWPTVALGDVVSMIKGDEVGSDNYIDYLEKKESDVPFIRTSDIVNYEIDQYPDFYVPYEIYLDLNQGIEAGDILFTNDGKIGQVCMVTEVDKFILQSHIRALKLNQRGLLEYKLTPEYLFVALSIREIGIYQSKMYTVIQSTIPTMSGNLPKVEIPILDEDTIKEITTLVREAFRLKAERKQLIADVRKTIDSYFDI